MNSKVLFLLRSLLCVDIFLLLAISGDCPAVKSLMCKYFWSDGITTCHSNVEKSVSYSWLLTVDADTCGDLHLNCLHPQHCHQPNWPTVTAECDSLLILVHKQYIQLNSTNIIYTMTNTINMFETSWDSGNKQKLWNAQKPDSLKTWYFTQWQHLTSHVRILCAWCVVSLAYIRCLVHLKWNRLFLLPKPN